MIRVAEKRYPPGTVQPRHAHATTSVSMVLAGAVRERVGRAEDVGRALSIVVKPAGTEHANEFGPAGRETQMLQLLLDEGAGGALLAVERRLAAWRWEHAGAAVPAFLRLLRAVRHAGDAEAVERATFDALGALSAVACEAGFFDQAHMCRAFRRGTGMTPSAYRALLAAR